MKTKLLSLLFAAVAACAHAGEAPAAQSIKHRFLAIDESRSQLLLVDERNPSAGWSLKLPVKSRDYQLIGKNQILLSGNDGYLIYDLQTRTLTKDLHDPRYKGSASVRRLRDGRTVIGCNQNGLTFYELGADDAVLNTLKFPELSTLRIMRLSPTGTMLFGANEHQAVEATLQGKILLRVDIPRAKHVYQVLRLPGGNLIAATGYGHFLAEIDASGKVVRELASPAALPGGGVCHFYSGFQILKNGNIVQCNWTGHGAQDSTKGPQLIELDTAGKLVWSWHDPALAGTIHGVLVLDDLNAAEFNDDCSAVLGATVGR